MAGNRKMKRIFLVCQEDISSKTCSKTVKFRDTDKIYILTEESSLKLPEGLLDYFNNQEQTISLKGEKSEALAEHLRSTRESDKDVYYFIGPGAKEFYHNIGSDVMLFSKGIAYNDTFGISKVPIEKPTQSEITDLESSFHSVSESLSMALEESVQNNSNYIPERKEAEENINKKNPSPESDKNAISVDNIQTISKVQKIEKEINENGFTKQIKVEHTDKKSDVKKDSIEIDMHNGAAELEEPIRLEMQKEEVKEPSVSERCMHAKATVVSCLLERFQEHLGIYTKREMEQETCFQFLQLLLKAKNPEDFTTSWKCQEPDSRISLSMEQFLDLKGEALYWYDISNLFYKGDLWNY